MEGREKVECSKWKTWERMMLGRDGTKWRNRVGLRGKRERKTEMEVWVEDVL